MEDNPRVDAKKLLDADLVEFAEQESMATRSVIVEVALPPPQVELTERESDGGQVRPLQVQAFDEDACRHAMAKLEGELRRLVSDKFVRLDSAQAFVVELNPAQLRELTLLSDTGVVRPNRTHHK